MSSSQWRVDYPTFLGFVICIKLTGFRQHRPQVFRQCNEGHFVLISKSKNKENDSHERILNDDEGELCYYQLLLLWSIRESDDADLAGPSGSFLLHWPLYLFGLLLIPHYFVTNVLTRKYHTVRQKSLSRYILMCSHTTTIRCNRWIDFKKGRWWENR